MAAALGAVAMPGRADAAVTGAPCNGSEGVTVVVDFSYWGGDIVRACAHGAPDNGLDALHDAGFSTAGTTQFGDAFVCRIAERPSTSEQSCTSTPPPSAYWASYFAAASAGSWTYSAVGALGLHPAPGSIQAWASGARRVPGISPAQAITPPAPPPPTAPPATAPPATQSPPVNPGGAPSNPAPGGGPPSGSPIASGSNGGGPFPGGVGSNATTPTSRGVATTTVARGSGAPTNGPSTTTTRAGAATDETADAGRSTAAIGATRDDRGSSIGVVIGIVLVFSIGAAAAGTALLRARRRREV
jgi:hypothetical protein